MGYFDYLWILKLIIEILKLIASMSPEDRGRLHDLREEIGDITA